MGYLHLVEPFFYVFFAMYTRLIKTIINITIAAMSLTLSTYVIITSGAKYILFFSA